MCLHTLTLNPHQIQIVELDFYGCKHISASHESICSVYSLSSFINILDRPRCVELAIHNLALVGVLVNRVEFLALQGHINSQIPANSHHPALESFTVIS
ncbi:hypothetical protein AYI69_g11100 [Smittium culicis]|uniref:Uncharacterized protein n=1 Tax=Smittium culicis TaxID=133412 RepID=A0A1R1X191_9FUNG|nr:hypothetical protein AYI69_g11100 [Smittium culicis]